MKDNKEKDIQELRYRLDKIADFINDFNFSAYSDSEKVAQLIGHISYYADMNSDVCL